MGNCTSSVSTTPKDTRSAIYQIPFEQPLNSHIDFAFHKMHNLDPNVWICFSEQFTYLPTYHYRFGCSRSSLIYKLSHLATKDAVPCHICWNFRNGDNFASQ